MLGGLEDLGETEELSKAGISVFGAPSGSIKIMFGCCCFDGKKAENGFGESANEGVTLLAGGETEGACPDEFVCSDSAGLRGGGCVGDWFGCGKAWKGVVGGFDSPT